MIRLVGTHHATKPASVLPQALAANAAAINTDNTVHDDDDEAT